MCRKSAVPKYFLAKISSWIFSGFQRFWCVHFSSPCIGTITLEVHVIQKLHMNINSNCLVYYKCTSCTHTHTHMLWPLNMFSFYSENLGFLVCIFGNYHPVILLLYVGFKSIYSKLTKYAYSQDSKAFIKNWLNMHIVSIFY
jgi:hypothetical protein